MDSSEIITNLNTIISRLQEQNSQLSEDLRMVSEKNIDLQQKAVLADSLQEQLSRLYRDNQSNSATVMDLEVDYQTEFSKQNELLRTKINQISLERDSYQRDAAQTQMLRDLLSKKNKENIELSQNLNQVQQELDILKLQYAELSKSDRVSTSDSNAVILTSETALQPIIDDLTQKNANLTTENISLKNQLTLSNKELAETKTLLNLVNIENQFFDKEITSIDNKVTMDMIKARVDKMSDEIFANFNNRIDDLDKKLGQCQQQVDAIQANKIIQQPKIDKYNVQDLLDEIEDLKDQLTDMQENDYAPQLAPALNRIKQLEEENNRLKKSA